jgi:hypothetical protein
MMKSFSLLAVAMTVACSIGNDKASAGQDNAETASADTGDTSTDEDSEDTASIEPVWWSLSGQLELEGGLPVIGTELDIVPLDETGAEVCAETAPVRILSVTDEPPPHESVLTWWRLELELPELLCDGIEVPLSEPSLTLGVGELHPDIRAALSAVDGLDTKMPLNGAYLAFDGADDLLVFGVAGRLEAFEGLGKIAEEAPLVDGGWRIEAVYWFGF